MDELGKSQSAAELQRLLAGHLRSKEWSEAAQVAVRLGKNRDAAGYFLQAQQPYEAAVCFQKAGALDECLEALVQVPETSARYRPACVHAIRVALTLEGQPIRRLSRLIVGFINSVPKSPTEATAFKSLAQAFTQQGKDGLALSLYKRVLAAFPEDGDARGAVASEVGEGGSAEPRPSPAPVRTASGANLKAAQPTPGGDSLETPRPPSAKLAAHRGQRLGQLLVERGKLTAVRLTKIVTDQPLVVQTELALWDALVTAGFVTDLDVIQALSSDSGIAYISEEKLLKIAEAEAVKALPVELAERWQVVPLTLEHRNLTVAMRDPRDMTLIDQIRFGAGLRKVTGVFAGELSIRKGIRKFYYGEDQEISGEDWRGMVLESFAPSPFADRFTKTREQEYDTGALEIGPPPAAGSKPARTDGGTVIMETGPEEVPLPAEGTVFAGRYRLEALIGKGGMSTVFRALDQELGERVAIKLYRPSPRAEELLARFRQELSLSRQLPHPNITRLYDLGFEGQWRYLTMELLEGTDLADMIVSRGGPLPVVEGLGYLEQACIGLQAAHDRGVIHRDIKPGNLFVTNEGTVKVMDFGIAKREHAQGVTVAGMIVGTPEFMSPEQVSGTAAVNHLTDLYALGATAYTMFTGSPPFVRPEFMAVLLAQVNEKPPPVRPLNPAVPPPVEQMILRLLEKDPAIRYGSCRELRAVLLTLREQLQATAPN